MVNHMDAHIDNKGPEEPKEFEISNKHHFKRLISSAQEIEELEEMKRMIDKEIIKRNPVKESVRNLGKTSKEVVLNYLKMFNAINFMPEVLDEILFQYSNVDGVRLLLEQLRMEGKIRKTSFGAFVFNPPVRNIV